MRIGYRTLKTAIGTPLAIWIAQILQLDNFVSAGIITILCIKPTRKKSFLHAWYRIGACLLAILLSWVIFELFGYSPLTIGLLLLLFIPATVKFQLTPGIVTSSVIILHLYSSERIDVSLILNEVILIILGVGIALLLNLYMPSLETNLKDLQQSIELNFSKILKEIANYLREGKQTWSGEEIIQTENLIKKAEQIGQKDLENHVFRGQHPYYDYFTMRKKQFDLLKHMLPLVSQLPGLYEQSYRMADLFEQLSEAVNRGNTASEYLKIVKDLRRDFNESELPKTRKEFETRANLYRLLYEIELYLIIKKNLTPERY